MDQTKLRQLADFIEVSKTFDMRGLDHDICAHGTELFKIRGSNPSGFHIKLTQVLDLDRTVAARLYFAYQHPDFRNISASEAAAAIRDLAANGEVNWLKFYKEKVS